ncbi:hypothetical protein DITRI_Ditri13aG0147200 [Diplodiscus trichospermus]
MQTVTVKKYAAPITLTSLTCLSGALLSAIVAAVSDHKALSWRLSWDMSLIAVLYSGIVIFGLTFYLQSLVGRTKGAVFITAFRPLRTVIATLMALLILGDVLFWGRYQFIKSIGKQYRRKVIIGKFGLSYLLVVGAPLIVVGLYLILWGKDKEKEKKSMEATTLAQNIEIRSEKS